MEAPRVYVASLDDAITLDAADRRHLTAVLRLRPGDALEVGDGAGRLLPAALTSDGIEATGPVRSVSPPRPALHVLQALPKGRRYDDIVRVLTELGVDRITAVAAERSVVRLAAGRADRARERWVAVGRAAAAQSRRAWLPRIDGPVAVGDVAVGAGVVAHVGAPASLRTVLASFDDLDAIAVAIGPEGGWSDAEVNAWERSGLVPVGLGPTVLRTEHAAAAVVAALASATGRWG